MHDLLRRLGDLSEGEIRQRSSADPRTWLADLETQRRAVVLRIAGVERWIAAEDAALYRDALGVAPPSGVPDAFLLPVERPLEELFKRFARHHGPFLTRDLAARFDLRDAQILPVLEALESAGVLVRGEIRPAGVELDWCDAEVLRRLKRRNLAQLRDEVAAVDASTLALFLPAWHGLNESRSGPERLREVVTQLQDMALPWSLLSTTILPRRVAGFRIEQLDMLAASGAVVWVGRGASGARDGRIALYLRDQIRDLLVANRDYEPPTPLHKTILDCLAQNGASFFLEIGDHAAKSEPGVSSRDLRAAIWDLVWAGQITNDTFAPLTELSRARPRRRRGLRGGIEPLAGGRWSLVASLVPQDPNPTQLTYARARLLLDRYGIVSRKCVQAEDMPGGFGPLYKVYREMEEQGRVRRGHFVDGLEGAQFAYAGAIDRLRSGRQDAEERDRRVTVEAISVLAAMDPANPYGATLPWPRVANPEQAKPRRVAGAWLMLARGRPTLYVGRRGSQLITFPDTIRDEEGALAAAIEMLRHLPKGVSRSMLVIKKVDGIDVLESSLLEDFRRAGYATDYRGLIDIQPPGRRHA